MRKSTLLESVMIQDKEGIEMECFNQEKIEEEVRKFYKDLYARKPTYATKQDILKYVGNSKIKQLNEEELARLGKGIEQIEVSKCLKITCNNMAPGASGFTGSFYKVFWKLLSSLVTRAINKSFKQGYLSTMQKLSIVNIIPKGDTDPRYLGNWHPLTLLNTFYKLISSILADRLKPILDRIIGGGQKAYMPVHYIGK